MARSIFLVQSDNSLIEMREQYYESEDILQQLLEDYPNLLVGDQINPVQPRKWLLIKREAGVAGEEGGGDRWSADHLFLDQDAIPTIVEVKRSTDTRIRREVVGQMLDYAANAVVYWSIEKLRAQFEATCVLKGVDAEQEVLRFIGADADADQFWQTVKINLQAGRVRLLFVADKIPLELRRIVEFLNEQMDPAEVLAVEIKQFVGANLQTLVPTVIGQTAEAQQRKSVTGRTKERLTESTFFQRLKENGATQEEMFAARKIFDWATPRFVNDDSWTSASFVPTLRHKGKSYYLFYVRSTDKKVEIPVKDYQERPPFDDESKRSELLRLLNEIDGIVLPTNKSYPSCTLAKLGDEKSIDQFLHAFDWAVAKLQAS